MREIVDDNWERLKSRVKDFWNRLFDENNRRNYRVC
jgi:hypothetical protein